MDTKNKRSGFTLVEVTAVLVLTGIALGFSTLLIETTVNVSVTNKTSAEDSQKIQVAVNRIVKELNFAEIDSIVVTNNGRTVQWTSSHPDRLGEICSASWDGVFGSDLELSSNGLAPTALLDHVGSFSISSSANSVSVSLASSRSEGVVHSSTIHPR